MVIFWQPVAAGILEGIFNTGDIAAVSEDGYVRILDRAKDLIKSGGKWISRLDLERAALAHPGVAAAAAVVGVPPFSLRALRRKKQTLPGSP